MKESAFVAHCNNQETNAAEMLMKIEKVKYLYCTVICQLMGHPTYGTFSRFFWTPNLWDIRNFMEKAENIREFSFCKLPETTECVDFLFPNSFYAIITRWL